MNRIKPTNTPTKQETSKKQKAGTLQNKVAPLFQDERTIKIVGTLCLVISAYLLLACISYIFHGKHDQALLFQETFSPEDPFRNTMGKLGAKTAYELMNQRFGIAALLLPLFTTLIGIRLLFRKQLVPFGKFSRHAIFGLLYLPLLFGFFGHEKVTTVENTIALVVNENLVGAYGLWITQWCVYSLGWFGTLLVVLMLAAGYSIINFNHQLNQLQAVFPWIKQHLPKFNSAPPSNEEEEEMLATPQNRRKSEDEEEDDALNDALSALLSDDEEEEEAKPEPMTLLPFAEDEENEEGFEEDFEDAAEREEDETKDTEIEIEQITNEEALSEDELDDKVREFGEYDPKLDLSRYELPSIELLKPYGSGELSINKDELEANKNKIVATLNNYKIEISKIKATIGPTVTLYEIIPAPGVRISKIKNLEDDIALSLAALGIRIIAPIPGKGTIGIEVPNSNPDMVSMRSLIATDKFQNSTMELPIALGKTISNETFVADLAKMPHLLMAGATGQGKSVGLNAILVSLLYKKHPSQIKFVLVDPKKVELTLFNKIERHFLAKLPGEEDAIITDTSKVVQTLNSLCMEMDDRYDLLKQAHCRNLKEYNAKFIKRKLNPENGHRFMPYIILVVDEFADLIMTAGKEVEQPIARLAQLARAIGIHLIIATQRPSVNIITGTIKANFPARIAFRVTSKIDSRTILDAGGADQLIGRGDMLFSTGNDLIRIQCGFVDTPEVEDITEFIGAQQGYPSAYILPEYIDDNSSEIGNLADDERDALFEDAARVIVMHQQGSASLLQRKLKLGYNRAGRIIDQLESAGIIGPFKGSKAREVLIPDDYSLEQLLNRGSSENQI